MENHTHLQELSTGNISKYTNQYVIAGSKHIAFSYMHSHSLHVQFDGLDFRRLGYTGQHSSDSLQFENSMFGGWVAWGHRVIGSDGYLGATVGLEGGKGMIACLPVGAVSRCICSGIWRTGSPYLCIYVRNQIMSSAESDEHHHAC